MALYAEPDCVLGQAVRWLLAEKHVEAELTLTSREALPEDILALNPYGEVLTLVDRDVVFYDANVMLDYLDERFPHPPLMPLDAVGRGRNRQLRARVLRDLHPAVLVLRAGQTGGDAEGARRLLRDHLTAIAPAFERTTHFFSPDFSLADCLFAPIVWRLPRWDVHLPAEAAPIIRYARRVAARPAFRHSIEVTGGATPAEARP